VANAFWNPFPFSGGLGRITTTHGEYLAIQFTVPADPVACAAGAHKMFSWETSQVDGEADVSRVFVTIRPCPGDFRLPPPDPAPAADPTFARGCTNYRAFAGLPAAGVRADVRYRIGTGVSDASACELACGQTYFLNFIRANIAPTGAIRPPALEVDPGFASNCLTVHPTTTRCGVQMRYF
jgi:hypothetical protein